MVARTRGEKKCRPNGLNSRTLRTKTFSGKKTPAKEAQQATRPRRTQRMRPTDLKNSLNQMKSTGFLAFLQSRNKLSAKSTQKNQINSNNKMTTNLVKTVNKLRSSLNPNLGKSKKDSWIWLLNLPSQKRMLHPIILINIK